MDFYIVAFQFQFCKSFCVHLGRGGWLAASLCCRVSCKSRVWAGRRGVTVMQNWDGVLWGFVFSFLSLALAPVCSKCYNYILISHRKQKCQEHHSCEPTSAFSELADFVTQKPSDLCSPLAARVRASLGDVCTASRCVSCYLYCPGLAEELGSCSPPGRRMWEEKMVVL